MPGLVDSTLREGSQAPVAYLTTAQKRALLAGVLRIGVEEVELGHAVAEPAYRPEPLADLLELAAQLSPRVRRAVWCRARPDDIEAAAALRPDVVSFALPVSDLHLARRLCRSREWALDQVGRLVALARAAGVGQVSVGLEDATRADPDFLDQVVAAIAAAGADRVRIADTVGIAEPGELVRLVQRVRAGFGGEVGVHVHDDFGMATAGAVAALQAGADWADVSLTGLGERAGIARTEEVAAWLVTRCGATYDLLAAREAALRLTGWVGRAVPSHAPVIGAEVFACESGLHLAGLAADPATYEPYPPELVGAERSWRLGQGSGRAAVAALVPDAGPDPTEAAARVRRAADRRGRALHPGEVAKVCGLLAEAERADDAGPSVRTAPRQPENPGRQPLRRSLMRSALRSAVPLALTLLALAGCAASGDAPPTTPSAQEVVETEESGDDLSGTLNVFAAASLTETFTELGDLFMAAHPGVTVTINFAASSALAAQIVSGAPADVFAAASPATMQTVVDAGAPAGEPEVFTRNTLEIAVPAGNPAGITGLADFTRPELTIALCAAEVPCGAAAEKVFDAAGLTPSPDTLEGDVKAALTKVELGEVDGALVYRTDVIAAADQVLGIEFPEASAAVNDYLITVLAEAPNAEAATAFVELVLSQEGRDVLVGAGFSAP